MFRCYICDFNPEGQSEYHSGLWSSEDHNYLIANIDGSFVCHECAAWYDTCMDDFELEDDDAENIQDR